MNTEKLQRLMSIVLVALLLAGCGGVSPEPTATRTQPPQSPLATSTEEAITVSESGFITGQVHGQAPPTPPMVVYAVDNVTGLWASIETQETDVAAPFTLEVPPGSYQVFACLRDGVGCSLGYSEDGWTLTTVTIEAGQTVSDIIVRPPSMSECGPTFGLPASPDGRFAAVDGPPEDCRAAVIATVTAEAEGLEVIEITPSVIELPDGTRCSFAGTGATLAFEGKRLNYTCEVEGQEVGLLGDVQQSEGVWKVEKVVIGHGDSGFFVQESEEVTMTIERIELADGTQCLFAGTGATLAFEGKRLNYMCQVEGQEVGLLGDLRQSEGIWTAEKAALGHGDSGFFVQELEEVTIKVMSGSAASAGMPNPASAFCEEQGGRVEIREGEGGQVGYCAFPDGSECEEWAFFRGECVPGGGEYQPPDSTVCGDLSKTMVQTLGVAVMTEEAPFQDYINGKAGTGCQMTATGTGLDFENFWSVAEALRETLGAQGWEADFMYAADGPTGTGNAFRKGNVLCLFSVGWEPSGDANCPQDQPISACELAPEQQLYTIRLNCAQDTTAAAVPQPEPEPTRIQFAPGATSAQVQGSLAAGGGDRYLLTAMAGQEMTVNLSVATAEVSAILVIWGADGTVLISDHADATTWVGQLPSTQDYYINVRSVAQAPVDYTLEVIIPPATADFTGQWDWESGDGSATFTLTLTQSGNQLQGSHVAIMQGGNRIDSLLPDLSIFGSVRGNMAEVTFQSSFASTIGQAAISHNSDTITWKVIVPPDQYFIPDEAVLGRATTP